MSLILKSVRSGRMDCIGELPLTRKQDLLLSTDSVVIETRIQHLSESVFAGLCEIVGTSQLVAIRRETVDIKEMMERRVKLYDWVIGMMSGSRREGFRLEGSDLDTMYWLNNHRVIMAMSQSVYYNTANTTLILSDSSESPPGFTLLQLLTPITSRSVQSACVRMNDRVYISSSIYRQITCSSVGINSTVHGPCASGVHAGQEYDYAYCFVCDFWPPSASSWINRCHAWPDPEVVDDIVRNGCHFVAIGHPLGPHEEEEWRCSFSQAEQKCVYAMNHCQFLTYGLLKIYLKEVINQQLDETSKLLCSYHIKTTIFWAIQQNTLPHWCPQNLLAGFWVCFKLLLKWVYEGTCPNFFIPQNNLFLTKVHGSAQNRLFVQLHELYKKGLACLLQSSSIRSNIIDVLYNPRAFVCTDESIMKSEVQYDAELFMEIYVNATIHTVNLPSCVKYLYAVEQLVDSPLTQYQVITLQTLTASFLQNTAFVLHNMYTNTSVNKKMYIADKISCQMLKLAAKFGCISDMLYIAMYYYKTLRYREALSVIEMTKVRLAQPYLMYRGHVGRERYIDTTLSQAALDELQVLVHHDQRMYVRDISRDISWEILGICQQITGNLQAALYSYQQSLTQYPFHNTQTATQSRIQDITGAVPHE
uniref:Protein mab-21 n=1 Tax=Magallana gigas TaxID=29159 RepID=K1QF40_MAGGI